MPAFNDKFVTALGKLVRVIKNGIQSLGRISPKYTINTFLIVLSGLILFFVFNWFKNEQTVKLVNEAVERVLIQSQKSDEQRDSIHAALDSPDSYKKTIKVDKAVRNECQNLLEELDADRVMLASFHNHEEGVLLHYLFYDEAYEVTSKRRHIEEVAQQYQKIRTSLTPLMGFLMEHTYYTGTYKKVYDIDMRYSHHMEENDTYFGAWLFLWSESGRPIGVLSCSWKKNNRRYIPKADTIELQMKVYGEVIRNIIDDASGDK